MGGGQCGAVGVGVGEERREGLWAPLTAPMMASPVGSSQTAKDLAPPDRSATLSEPVTPTSGSKQQSKLEYKAQRKQYDMEKKQRRNKAMVCGLHSLRHVRSRSVTHGLAWSLSHAARPIGRGTRRPNDERVDQGASPYRHLFHPCVVVTPQQMFTSVSCKC